MRIAINGLGRIGRQALKVALVRQGLEVVAVNDLTEVENMAYLLRFDSVYGRYSEQIYADFDSEELVIAGNRISYLSEENPEKLPWKSMRVDVVVESTGRFASHLGGLRHINAGARRVVISANAADADISIVMGVNHDDFDPTKHQIMANCSCTTNAAAPIAKVLNDNFNIRKAFLTTVHGVTASQRLVDGPHKDWRRGRAAFASIVPTTTGAAKAVSRVIPELEGRITGSAYRVPVLAGSIVEVVATIAKETSAEEVNQAFRQAAQSQGLKGIVEVSDEKLVSADILGTTASAIIDSSFTEVINFPDVKDENLVRVTAWYDNEHAYAERLMDLVELVGR
jgi:glyceraldehyde 3-phosphate dehydrogenase